ncbi:hypothetical protein ES705_41245 [subsurface metagenome]
MKELFLRLNFASRFFLLVAILTALVALSFGLPFLFYPSLLLLTVLIVTTFLDIFILFQFRDICSCRRRHQLLLSLDDDNEIKIQIRNLTSLPLKIRIIDELPEQLQDRNFLIRTTLSAREHKEIRYTINPKERGNYNFGSIVVFSLSTLRLAERKDTYKLDETIPVYPSIIQMHQYEILALSSISNFQGVKKIRRIGHSYEFEQIKSYVPGDDSRSLNWKASSRAGTLMVNQYEDERAQPIYSVIDKSRIMKMPFNGLSLLDYAINTSLVIANIALRKHDKAGLLTFGNKLGSFIKAGKQYSQLRKILQALYAEKESSAEANYELLYSAVRNFIRGRSLLFLYSNFESVYALERILPLLRKINRLHLLVLIFFENTELSRFAEQSCEDLLDIQQQTAARNFIQQKDLIFQELSQHGIQAIKTRPEDLSLNTINKYLELKARGYI